MHGLEYLQMHTAWPQGADVFARTTTNNNNDHDTDYSSNTAYNSTATNNSISNNDWTICCFLWFLHGLRRIYNISVALLN